MRNSEKISQTFNGAVQWLIAGGYFKLMSTVNAVTVELYNKGERVHLASNVEGGHYQRIDFDRVAITTGALEAVSWLYAPQEGGSDRFTGDVNVTDRAVRLLGIVYGTLGQVAQELLNGVNALVVACKGTLGTHAQRSIGGANALLVEHRSSPYGVSFKSTAGLTANTAEQIFAAASNPNGAIVHRASMMSMNATNLASLALLAKTTAPANVNDGDVYACNDFAQYNTTGPIIISAFKLERPIEIPAGVGLYFIASVTEVGFAQRSCLYTLR